MSVYMYKCVYDMYKRVCILYALYIYCACYITDCMCVFFVDDSKSLVKYLTCYVCMHVHDTHSTMTYSYSYCYTYIYITP